jgi:hypothetical protein
MQKVERLTPTTLGGGPVIALTWVPEDSSIPVVLIRMGLIRIIVCPSTPHYALVDIGIGSGCASPAPQKAQGLWISNVADSRSQIAEAGSRLVRRPSTAPIRAVISRTENLIAA